MAACPEGAIKLARTA
ncbi:hypothetical protein [Paraburkholderia youngii]